ncbi:unnamed protein product [Pleuronectes platessa]|uniref:Uncharacterized protein n=1 Tax=Pleuronectes platessa TaxID=8262 RepID=A0A9N7Z8G3_PLEPL|nr:unnamed protein product [Pleuronectes platessa]
MSTRKGRGQSSDTHTVQDCGQTSLGSETHDKPEQPELKAGACFCNCVGGISGSCVAGLFVIHASPSVAPLTKQFPARKPGGGLFFVEDDLRDAFFLLRRLFIYIATAAPRILFLADKSASQ